MTIMMMSLSFIVSQIWRVISGKLEVFSYVDTVGFPPRSSASKKLELLRYHVTLRMTGRQTGRRTDRHGAIVYTCISIASRGKNGWCNMAFAVFLLVVFARGQTGLYNSSVRHSTAPVPCALLSYCINHARSASLRDIVTAAAAAAAAEKSGKRRNVAHIVTVADAERAAVDTKYVKFCIYRVLSVSL